MNDATYYDKVTDCVRQALLSGSLRFCDLVRACQGAYPSLVWQILKEMGPQVISVRTDVWSLATANRAGARVPSALSTIEGNPVLQSWYFTDRTCLRIEQLWNWASHRIAFLGTPRLYEWFATANLGESRVLLDLDPLVTRILSASVTDQIVQYDVRDPLPERMAGQFTCVICDPPWYPEEYALWLERARELASGGVVCVSLFPVLTRPSSAHERQVILKAMRTNFSFLTTLTEFLEYEIPSFEFFELAHFGLTGLGPWKLADLVIGQLNTSSEGAATLSPNGRPAWTEIDFGTLRLFVNGTAGSNPEGPLLATVVGGSDILPSPSRREPILQAVNVLSSRGHGLLSHDPLHLINILDGLSAKPANSVSMEDEIGRLNIDPDSKEVLRRLLRQNHSQSLGRV